MRDISLVRWKKDVTGDDYIETEIKISPSDLSRTKQLLENSIETLRGHIETTENDVLIKIMDKTIENDKALLAKLESLT